ncbi:hypothetical protein [Paractinoplanes hotanensis]|uniref:Uncharacterized protein n=1 Tax=Paractinoplanes hotanensis TaxID=2906497 RepID=A0ABT0XZ43_9ACTN|nr:hypothetical protein [Actinoplanes hotanensis]MCM4078452.1 hypothetical protein [Actinoplanes hotanensis]
MAVLVLTAALVVHSLLRAALKADFVVVPAWFPVTVLSFAVPLALFVSVLVWTNLTKRIVESYGGLVTVVRNWAMTSGWLILVLSYVLPAKTPTAFHLGRAAGGLLLIAGLLISRVKLQRWLAEPTVRADPAPAVRADSGVSAPGLGQRPLLPPVETQPRDWDAAAWDPEIQADIERRRRRTDPSH